ncbi:hypothetical protein AC481_04325 [miscellaneous Crenarchaeota group archaeon SMTZ-80]|nr:MAG: hypothetical protein AC481_04325 [miscellaneous Crenarchaeota group archaeon SMTZ-80]
MKIKTKSKPLVAILALAMIMGFFIFAIGTTRADSEVIYVDPSWDITGDTDTIAIQNAFDAASSAGSGSSIILGEGIFYIKNTIYITDFDGIFKGQGKGKTIVVNEHSDSDPFPADPYPDFFVFHLESIGTNPEVPAKLEVADITFKAIGKTELWDSWPWAYNMDESFYSIIGIEQYLGEYFYNVKLDGIEILGEYYINSWGQSVPNILEPITLWTPHAISGDISISDCYIANSFQPIAIYGLTNSIIDISYNTFENSLIRGTTIVNCQYTNAKISRNIGINSGIIGTYGTPFTYSNNYLIEHNKATNPVDGWTAAVEIYDYTFLEQNYVVTHNELYSEDSFYGPGLWIDGGKSVLIANNKIKGTGPFGMAVGVYEPTDGIMIIGNNFQGWEVADYNGMWGFVPGIAPIWLGGASANCIVLGHANDMVADYGTNNILIGVSKIQGPVIGQEIQEAMEQKKELMKYF